MCELTKKCYALPGWLWILVEGWLGIGEGKSVWLLLEYGPSLTNVMPEGSPS